jgi:hypothetical protein
MKNLTLALAILVTLIINGCTKGKDGAPGPSGSSNVSALNYTPTWYTSSSSTYWYANLSVPALTQSNINSAAVQVYFSTTSGVWVAVPFTQVASTNYFMNFLTAVNTVEITWTYNGGLGSDPNTYYGATVQAKVVVIPPAAMRPNVNYRNYQEVKVAYNLKD